MSTGVTRKLLNAARNPKRILMRKMARAMPPLFYANYSREAEKQGFRKPCFIFSFDCDTPDDIEAAPPVHEKCLAAGVTPVYAVPGAILEMGADVFRRIAESGAEFINHGYDHHAEWDREAKKYVSRFFYDQLSEKTIMEDIRRGHNAVAKVTGKPPEGFRGPHFGTFQKPAQIQFLHVFLSELGYRFSSSTTPEYGISNGPAPRAMKNLYEIPLSGNPLEMPDILDTWGAHCASDRAAARKSYQAGFGALAALYSNPLRTGLINLYGDPSHVRDWPEFFECLKTVSNISIPSFGQLLDELEHAR